MERKVTTTSYTHFETPQHMAAIKKLAKGPGLAWCPSVNVPVPGPRDVLVAVTHAGICGTDRHIYEWDAWSSRRVPLGITTGHEFVGRVAAVGCAVSACFPGQRVSAEGHIGCGRCQPCRTGNAHICEKVDIIGIDRDGCFAQYVCVPEENIWPVHADISDHHAAIFDPLGNAMNTVMSAGVSGRSVLITGVGIIGLMAVAMARYAGATKVIVTDTNPNRLTLARKLGADVAFNGADSDWYLRARQQTAGMGPQVLLEMSGHPGAISQGFKALSNGGTAALLGLPSQAVSLDLPDDIIFKGATVLGINGRRMYETWYQVENFLLSGRVKIDPIITHLLPIEKFDYGFALMQSGEAIKVILKVPQAEVVTCQAQASIPEPQSCSVPCAAPDSSSNFGM